MLNEKLIAVILGEAANDVDVDGVININAWTIKGSANGTKAYEIICVIPEITIIAKAISNATANAGTIGNAFANKFAEDFCDKFAREIADCCNGISLTVETIVDMVAYASKYAECVFAEYIIEAIKQL